MAAILRLRPLWLGRPPPNSRPPCILFPFPCLRLSNGSTATVAAEETVKSRSVIGCPRIGSCHPCYHRRPLNLGNRTGLFGGCGPRRGGGACCRGKISQQMPDDAKSWARWVQHFGEIHAFPGEPSRSGGDRCAGSPARGRLDGENICCVARQDRSLLPERAFSAQCGYLTERRRICETSSGWER